MSHRNAISALVAASLLTVTQTFGIDYTVRSSEDQFTCSNAGNNDRCILYCDEKEDAKHDEHNYSFDCGNASDCQFNCNADKCFNNGVLTASNSDNLNVISSGKECMKSATIYSPNYGNATFSMIEEKSFKEMTVNAGTKTQNIIIDCTFGKGDECKQMVVNAETAQYLEINVGANSEMDGKEEDVVINCPQNSNYNGPQLAPCIIDLSNGGLLTNAQINTLNGIPIDVWIYWGDVTASNVNMTCNGISSSIIDNFADCWHTESPTINPTKHPITSPTKSPTKLPSISAPTPSPSTIITSATSTLTTTTSTATTSIPTTTSTPITTSIPTTTSTSIPISSSTTFIVDETTLNPTVITRNPTIYQSTLNPNSNDKNFSRIAPITTTLFSSTSLSPTVTPSYIPTYRPTNAVPTISPLSNMLHFISSTTYITTSFLGNYREIDDAPTPQIAGIDKNMLLVIFLFIIFILGGILLFCIYKKWAKSHAELVKGMKNEMDELVEMVRKPTMERAPSLSGNDIMEQQDNVPGVYSMDEIFDVEVIDIECDHTKQRETRKDTVISDDVDEIEVSSAYSESVRPPGKKMTMSQKTNSTLDESEGVFNTVNPMDFELEHINEDNML